MKKLTYIQKIKLRELFRDSKDSKERDRIRVILNCDEGVCVKELAKILIISESLVRKYIDDYWKKNKTHGDPKGGSESHLTIEESQLLNQHLTEHTYLKVKNICFYAQETFHKKFSRSGMTKWLHHHQFVFKRPKSVPGKLDPKKQEQFIREYQELKNKLKDDEVILFGDSVHPEYQSRPVCGWIKKGEEKTLQTTGKQTKMHVVGAIDLNKMEVVTKEYKSVNAEAMIDFCKKLEQYFSASTIYLILDNARAGKNKELDRYLKSSRIKIKYLPPYSPNLNSLERLWKIMREETLNNRYYNSVSEFFFEIRNFFGNLKNRIKSYTSRINDNFEKIELNPIHIAAG